MWGERVQCKDIQYILFDTNVLNNLIFLYFFSHLKPFFYIYNVVTWKCMYFVYLYVDKIKTKKQTFFVLEKIQNGRCPTSFVKCSMKTTHPSKIIQKKYFQHCKMLINIA